MHSYVDGFSDTHRLLAEIETRQAEIKKHNQKLSRFGEAGLRQHAQREQVQLALKLLQPEQLNAVLQNASLALNGASPQTEGAMRGEVPQLAQGPSHRTFGDAHAQASSHTAEQRNTMAKTASARLLELLGVISQLTSRASVQNVINQLTGYNAMLTGASARYDELAHQLEQQGTRWADAHDALQQAQKLADAAQQGVEQAEKSLDEAHARLQQVEGQAAGELEATGELSPGLQDSLDDARQAVTQAQAKTDAARSAYDDVTRNRLTPAINLEKQTKAQLQETAQQAQRLASGFSAPQVNAIEAQRKERNAESISLTYLMAVIAQLIAESTSEDMHASSVLKQKLAEAAAKEAERKGKEYDEMTIKAEEQQKTMGCIGKTIGWVLTAVSFAAVIFTGGASLALAGIGLALALGDQVYQMATGESFLQEALQPIMEYVVKPLTEFLANCYSAILQFYGVDKKIAEEYKMIFGAIAAAVLLVAAVFVAGNLVSKLAGALIEKVGANALLQATKEMMKKVLTKIMDSGIGQFVKRIGASAGRIFSMNEVQAMRLSSIAQGAQAVGGVGASVVQTVGSVSVANLQVEAEKVRAQLLNNMALQEILNEMIERAVETFSHRLAGVNAIIENMASVAENQWKAGQHITRKMGAVAG